MCVDSYLPVATTRLCVVAALPKEKSSSQSTEPEREGMRTPNLYSYREAFFVFPPLGARRLTARVSISRVCTSRVHPRWASNQRATSMLALLSSSLSSRSTVLGSRPLWRGQSMPPPGPAIAFVRATPTAITLDFLATSPAVEAYELGFGPVDGSEDCTPSKWIVASSSLKLSRCTKSSLTPGAAYCFRARAKSAEGWGPYGPCTAAIRTLLPELPTDCSESLKVPSKVLAAQAEVEAWMHLEPLTARAARAHAAHAQNPRGGRCAHACSLPGVAGGCGEGRA